MKREPVVQVFATLLLLIAGACPVLSQPQHVKIVASVLDNSGASWAFADVALVNIQTWELSKMTTRGDGVATFEVSEGRYVLIATPSPGNNCVIPAVQQIRVAVAETANVKLVLNIDVNYGRCGEPIT